MILPGPTRRRVLTGAALTIAPAWWPVSAWADDFLPHAVCYLWDPFLVWLHASTDTLIGLAYLAIAGALAVFVHRARHEVPFDWMFLAAGGLFLFCGLTHLIAVWTVWDPRYWTAGGVKAVTAVASVATALLLPPLVPKAVALVQATRVAEAREKALRASEARYRGLLESAPDGVVIVDGAGRITIVNGEAQRLFGYAAEELLGQPVEILLPAGARSRHVGHRAAYSARPATRPMGAGLDLAGRRKDGSEFPVEISLSPHQTDEGLLVTAIIRDITERKRVEAQVKALNEDLERRVVQLASVNRELETFSYSVSHDLRAPLRGIDGFGQALEEEYRDRLDAQGQDYLRRIRAATRRMGALIDDLLNLAHVTRREMTREAIDLSALARAVVGQLRRAEPARQVNVTIAEGLVAQGDPHLLRVVLENLLGNAWKFTGKTPGGTIEFRVTAADGRPAYFVRDNGVGFDVAYADKLFGAFQRLHSMNEFPGTGIGLATVQRIVTRHGGRVWAEAAIGKGATFYFTL